MGRVRSLARGRGDVLDDLATERTNRRTIEAPDMHQTRYRFRVRLSHKRLPSSLEPL
jgi:hypothetical protein